MNNKFSLQVQQIIQETPDAISIHLNQPDPPIQYLPGQFLTLLVPINGKEVRRCYSLCSSPFTDSHLAVAVKRVEGGLVSGYLIDHLKVGDTLTVLAPAGNFCCNTDQNYRHIVLIGGGSGITPLLSIIKSVLTQETLSKVSLVYVNSCQEKTIFHKQLDAYAQQYASRFRVVYYWSDVEKAKKQKTGLLARIFEKKYAYRLNSEKLKLIFENLGVNTQENTLFYLCGPQGLMKIAHNTIKNLGFDDSVVHKENFRPLDEVEGDDAKSTQDFTVTVVFEGKEHQVRVPAGKSILFAGLDAGLDLPYSCQSGICSTCAAKCWSGQVAMASSEGLTQSEKEKGFVLTCVGYAHSHDVKVEYS